jgi:hypothetical protein
MGGFVLLILLTGQPFLVSIFNSLRRQDEIPSNYTGRCLPTRAARTFFLVFNRNLLCSNLLVITLVVLRHSTPGFF